MKTLEVRVVLSLYDVFENYEITQKFAKEFMVGTHQFVLERLSASKAVLKGYCDITSLKQLKKELNHFLLWFELEDLGEDASAKVIVCREVTMTDEIKRIDTNYGLNITFDYEWMKDRSTLIAEDFINECKEKLGSIHVIANYDDHLSLLFKWDKDIDELYRVVDDIIDMLDAQEYVVYLGVKNLEIKDINFLLNEKEYTGLFYRKSNYVDEDELYYAAYEERMQTQEVDEFYKIDIEVKERVKPLYYDEAIAYKNNGNYDGAKEKFIEAISKLEMKVKDTNDFVDYEWMKQIYKELTMICDEAEKKEYLEKYIALCVKCFSDSQNNEYLEELYEYCELEEKRYPISLLFENIHRMYDKTIFIKEHEITVNGNQELTLLFDAPYMENNDKEAYLFYTEEDCVLLYKGDHFYVIENINSNIVDMLYHVDELIIYEGNILCATMKAKVIYAVTTACIIQELRHLQSKEVGYNGKKIYS